MGKYLIHYKERSIKDLTPLKGLSLKRLIFTPGRIKKKALKLYAR